MVVTVWAVPSAAMLLVTSTMLLRPTLIEPVVLPPGSTKIVYVPVLGRVTVSM